jgi:hypothetical protein
MASYTKDKNLYGIEKKAPFIKNLPAKTVQQELSFIKYFI